MKFKNKKTGQEGNFIINKDHFECVDLDLVPEYNSLAELNEDWEDYEEPKEYWFINDLDGKPMKCELRYCPVRDFADWIEKRKQIGNYFETKEEAEKAVEKLKAFKRLRDKGFKFTEWYRPDGCEPFIVVETNIDYDDVENRELQKHLDLLFGE